MSNFANLPLLERSLLSAMTKALPLEIAKVIEAQIEQFNVVERRESGSFVDFHKRERGRDYEVVPLLSTKGVLEIATITFTVSPSASTFVAKVFLSNGQVYSIGYEPVTKPISDLKQININRIEINEYSLNLISGKKCSFPVELQGEIRRILEDWAQFREAYHVPVSAPPDERDRLVRDLLPLPSDYVELAKYTDGVSGTGLGILSISNVYEVTLANETFLMLSEIENKGMFGVKRKPSSVEVWYCDYEGDVPESLGESLLKAMDAKLHE